MLWTKVFIRGDDTASPSGAALVERLSAAYRAAGMPPGVEVRHLHIPWMGDVYYLSPKAGEIAGSVLGSYRDVVLVEKPDFARLVKRIRL
jgi:hypothetical protein